MISTDDKDASEYFKSYKNFGRKAINRSYDIEQNGFKFYMNNLNATIALCSLEEYDRNLNIRKKNYNTIASAAKNINMLVHDIDSSYYFSTCISEKANDSLEKISIVRHYPMLHKTSYFKNENKKLFKLEELHDKILNIPIHHNLSQKEINRIVSILNES